MSLHSQDSINMYLRVLSLHQLDFEEVLCELECLCLFHKGGQVTPETLAEAVLQCVALSSVHVDVMGASGSGDFVEAQQRHH